jgi:hypothetical protein
MSPQGDPPTVLKKKEYLPEGIVALVEASRSGEQVLRRAIPTALAEMRGRIGEGPPPKGSPTSRTERRIENPDPPPAPATDD